MMDTKQALYAAVGAPIATARQLSSRLETLRSQLEKRSEGLSKSAAEQIEVWADEGRQVMSRVSDGRMVEEIAAKVDFDQAREQVTRLRDQLEDMLATWRTSFRPVEDVANQAARTTAGVVEEAAEKVGKAAERVDAAAGSRTAEKPAAEKPTTKKPAAKTPAANKPAAKKPTTKKPAAKTPAANKSA
jgi:hypothetical protein